MRTITGLYDSYDDARAAVKALEDAGVSSDDISIVSHKNGKEDIEGQGSNAAEGAGHREHGVGGCGRHGERAHHRPLGHPRSDGSAAGVPR